jgi:hypothetical protein
MSLTPSQQAIIRNQAQEATTRSLRHRRYRLTRAIARIENVLAEINLELSARGVPLETYASFPRRIIPGVRHGEMAPLCMTILRAATEPLMVREIATEIAVQKGLDQTDAVLMGKMIERVSSAMEVFSRRKVIRIAGNPRRRKGAHWVVTAPGSWR